MRWSFPAHENRHIEELSQLLMHAFAFFLLLCRCCLLEPGPVRTACVPKALEWGQDRGSTPKVDPKTVDLMNTTIANIEKEFGSAMQTCEECAQFVKEIILGEKYNLRCQTNEKFGSKEVAAKLAEPTGNASVNIITTRYLGETKQE